MGRQLIYDETAGIAKALGHPSRARILDLLFQTERHVDDLAGLLDAGVTTVSNHLQILKSAGLVEARRDGTRLYYRIADETVLSAWLALRTVAENRSPQVQQLLREMAQRDESLEPIDAQAALDLALRGKATLIDVRPRAEFESGHLPGAISMPPDEVEQAAGDVPTGRTAITYCRDRYCVFAPSAAEQLKKRGIDTRLLEIGVAEWRDLGLPLDDLSTSTGTRNTTQGAAQ